jgi:hypothetical protein
MTQLEVKKIDHTHFMEYLQIGPVFLIIFINETCSTFNKQYYPFDTQEEADQKFSDIEKEWYGEEILGPIPSNQIL